MSPTLIKTIVEECKSDLHRAKEDPKFLDGGIKRVNRNVKILYSMANNTTTVGEKTAINTAIGHLYGFRVMMKKLRVVGGSHKVSDPNRKNYASNNVKWDDVESAFQTRIRTGVITNLKHKEPSNFLTDCAKLFKRRILNELKKKQSLKVNTVFCGEFKITKSDEEICELKYMNTKNAPIYQNTDLFEWFEVNVKKPILADLEEFQEKDSGWTVQSSIWLFI